MKNKKKEFSFALFSNFLYISIILISGVIVLHLDHSYQDVYAQGNGEGETGLVPELDTQCLDSSYDNPTYLEQDGCLQPCPDTDSQEGSPMECSQSTEQMENLNEESTSLNNPDSAVDFSDSDILTQQDKSTVTDPSMGPDSDILTQQDKSTVPIPPLGPCFNDLSGQWNGNDGGTYYIRQIGNDIWWFGSNIFTGNSEFKTFSNAFHGERNGMDIAGKWQDIPIGETRGNGDISLLIADTGLKLTKISDSGDFSGTSWNRVC